MQYKVVIFITLVLTICLFLAFLMIFFILIDMLFQVYPIAGHILKHAVLGDYVRDKVLSLKHFMSKGNEDNKNIIPSLVALSSAMRLLQRWNSKTELSRKLFDSITRFTNNCDAILELAIILMFLMLSHFFFEC